MPESAWSGKTLLLREIQVFFEKLHARHLEMFCLWFGMLSFQRSLLGVSFRSNSLDQGYWVLL